MLTRRVLFAGLSLSVLGCASKPVGAEGFDGAPITEGVRRRYAAPLADVDRAALDAGRKVVAAFGGAHEERSGEMVTAAYSGMVLKGDYPLVHYWRHAGRIVVQNISATQTDVYVRSEAMRLGAPASANDPFVSQVFAALAEHLTATAATSPR